MNDMNEQTQWLAKCACREVIEQSVRHVDNGDAEAFSRLFTDDAVLVRPSGAALHGRAAIRQSYAARPAQRITRHLVTGTVVEVAQDESEFERLKRREAELRTKIRGFRAADNVPRDELYRRGE